MKVLDLFSGLEGWSGPMREQGHDVYRVELLEMFQAEHRDVLDFHPSMLPWKPDLIVASPPCTSFSMMSIGTHWTHDNQPKTSTAEMGIRLVRRSIELVKQIKPSFWVIENPRAKLRKMEEMQSFERRTVTYCQYGERRMKPTDLWGGFPPSLVLDPMCKNGSPCHVAAPRGSRTGTQGMNKYESAKIPRELSLSLMRAAEMDLSKGAAWNAK